MEQEIFPFEEEKVVSNGVLNPLSQLETEELMSAYFDKDALRLPNYQLFRFGGAFRTYYAFGEKEVDGGRIKRVVPNFYIGVTSLLKAVLPTSPYLIEWLLENGKEQSQEMAEERAEYGTMMHNCIERLLIDREFDLDAIGEMIDGLLLQGAVFNRENWIKWLRQDVLAFARFMLDFNVKPLAVEVSLKSDKLRVAGTSDLFCSIDWDVEGYYGEVYKSGPIKGEGKKTKKKMRMYALIDFKSSRKGVHLDHELQLQIYEQLIRENFPEFDDVPILLFNWRPKNWRKQPDYVLTNQTGKHKPDLLDNLRKTFFMMNDIDGKERLFMGGKLKLDDGIESNYSTESLEDLLLRKHGLDGSNDPIV